MRSQLTTAQSRVEELAHEALTARSEAVAAASAAASSGSNAATELSALKASKEAQAAQLASTQQELAVLKLRAATLEGEKARAESAATEASDRAAAAAASGGLGDEERALIQEAAKKKIKELKKQLKAQMAAAAEELVTGQAQATQDAAGSLFTSAKAKLGAHSQETGDAPMTAKQVLKMLKTILREMTAPPS